MYMHTCIHACMHLVYIYTHILCMYIYMKCLTIQLRFMHPSGAAGRQPVDGNPI